MKNIFKIVAGAVVAVALTSSVQAVPITGVIGFSGTAQLDASTVAGSHEVLSWGSDNTVGIANGSFLGLTGLPVALAAPWFFNSGALNNFWSVSTFHFNLSSSAVFQNAGGFLSVVLAGTVTGAPGLDPTAFVGRVTIQDPATVGGGLFHYTESLSFNAVPDGGTTALLLGSALSGLALIRRKLVG